MVSGTLYCHPNSFRSFRILVAAKYGNSHVKINSSLSAEQFAEKFPFGTPLAFEDGDLLLTSAAAVAFYVGGKEFTGDTDKRRAEIYCWCSYADCDYLPTVLGTVLPALSVAAHNKQQVDASKSELLSRLRQLNDYLLGHTYLVGEAVSLADVTLVCNLLLAYQHVLDAPLRKQFQNVTRWFETIVNQPHFLEVVGSVKLCEKPAEFDAKKHNEFTAAAPSRSKVTSEGDAGHQHPSPGAAQSGKKDKKHDKKQQEPAQPKEEKAPAAPKMPKEQEQDEEMDETERALAEEPKKKDPFEAFPKGTFVMDDWKKMYSNNDTRSVALPWFWEHFDPAHYSVWFCEYKYPKDLTQVFMSCNLIAGMFQRLEKMHKHAFGSMILFGEASNSQIAGIWVWRGHELAFTLSDDWQIDYESYNWKKLDVTNPEARKTIDNFMAWEGELQGNKVNQGKVFK